MLAPLYHHQDQSVRLPRALGARLDRPKGNSLDLDLDRPVARLAGLDAYLDVLCGATGGRCGQSAPLYAWAVVASAAGSLWVHYIAHRPPAIRR